MIWGLLMNNEPILTIKYQPCEWCLYCPYCGKDQCWTPNPHPDIKTHMCDKCHKEFVVVGVK